MGITDFMEQAQKQMEQMPKCDRCGGHLAGGSLTFNNIDNTPKTWCMKCVLEALSFFQRERKERLDGR